MKCPDYETCRAKLQEKETLAKASTAETDDADKLSDLSKISGTIYYGEEWGEFHDYFIGIGPWPRDASKSDELSESSLRVLNFLESGSAISILEDLHYELLILKYVIGAPVVSSWDFTFKTLDERFQTSDMANRMFPEVDSTPVLTTPLKLQRDRQFLEKIVKDTLQTLLDDGTFEPIIESARGLAQNHFDEVTLVEEVKQNLAYLKDIKARVKEKRRLDDLEEKQRDELLYKLQDEIDDVILQCSVDEKFVDKWENTRDKQNKWRLRISEDFYKDGIMTLLTKSTMEDRVNQEMQSYIKSNQLELEEELEEWMTRYDTEMERRENKILQLKYMRDQAEDEVKRLESLYEMRKTEMREWVTFREIRKRRAAASLMIQSWWRGFMVRKKLGPYKEKKQKGQKAEKKK